MRPLFLLTPLREGRPVRPRYRSQRHRYFYSRPCGRGDFHGFPVIPWDFVISTHAPAGGATLPLPQRRRLCCISTHAPAGGATFAAMTACTVLVCISTHAPAGGATEAIMAFTATATFLLTPLREGRPYLRCERICDAFISTHAPAGGATNLLYVNYHKLAISTHAPAGGATLQTAAITQKRNTFLLTPLREGRRDPRRRMSRRRNFYSRPCGRGDVRRSWLLLQRQHFYSRPCGRGDKKQPWSWKKIPDFYSRPCGRGDTAPCCT